MSDVRFGSWSVAESPVTVEYSFVAIEEIRREVSDGFQKLSRGGVEVGGILYGTRDGRTLSVLTMRAMACEHARGPSFLLSEADRSALEQQIEHESEDAGLEGLVRLGWFLSHTRSEIMLSDSDRELYSSYFGAPWQVTLVIRPGRGGSMRAGFFVREPDGTVKSESSYLEFNFPDRLAGVLDLPPRGERAMPERSAPDRMSAERTMPERSMPDRTIRDRRPQPYAAAESGTAVAPARREAPLASPVQEAPRLLPAPPRRSRWPWLLVWALVVIALALVGLRYYSFTRLNTEPMALAVTEQDGQLRIEWNHSARPVAAAARGSLVIVDGTDTRTIALTPTDLATGSFSYARNADDVEIRMTVESPRGEEQKETSHFLGRPAVKVDPKELTDLQRQRDALQAEVGRLIRENQAQGQRVQELERTLRILQARMDIK